MKCGLEIVSGACMWVRVRVGENECESERERGSDRGVKVQERMRDMARGRHRGKYDRMHE